jgi:aspartate aminotransferase
MPDAWYEQVRAIYRTRVDAMMAALARLPGVRASRPEGAFYTMAALPVRDTEAFARFLVTDFRSATSGRAESVVVAPGPGFYADSREGRSEVRLAAVNDATVLERGVELLGLALVAWNQR